MRVFTNLHTFFYDKGSPSLLEVSLCIYSSEKMHEHEWQTGRQLSCLKQFKHGAPHPTVLQLHLLHLPHHGQLWHVHVWELVDVSRLKWWKIHHQNVYCNRIHHKWFLDGPSETCWIWRHRSISSIQYLHPPSIFTWVFSGTPDECSGNLLGKLSRSVCSQRSPGTFWHSLMSHNDQCGWSEKKMMQNVLLPPPFPIIESYSHTFPRSFVTSNTNKFTDLPACVSSTRGDDATCLAAFTVAGTILKRHGWIIGANGPGIEVSRFGMIWIVFDLHGVVWPSAMDSYAENPSPNAELSGSPTRAHQWGKHGHTKCSLGNQTAGDPRNALG